MSTASGRFGDRIRDTASSINGTTVTLSNSAPTGFQTFGSFYSNADICPSYLISDGTHWEISYGAYTASGTTLARASTPIASSNAGAQVTSFSGTTYVAAVKPAAQINSFLTGLLSGRAYNNYLSGTATVTGVAVLGQVNYVPVFIRQWFSSVNLHARISALAGGTATMDIGLYDTKNGAPNSRLGQVTGLNVGTGGATGDIASGSITMSSPQPPGLYWVATAFATTAPTLNLWGPSNAAGVQSLKEIIGIADITAFNTTVFGLQQSSQATLPTTAAPDSALTLAAAIHAVVAT